MIEVHSPPAVLYTACEEPDIRALLTVGDVMDYLLDYRFAFEKCSSKVDHIRNWVETSKGAAE